MVASSGHLARLWGINLVRFLLFTIGSETMSVLMLASSLRQLLIGSAVSAVCFVAGCLVSLAAVAADDPKLPQATIDGTGPGWRELGESDFTNVNCEPTTWSFKDGVIHCTGQPVGVIRTKKTITNFELVAEWCHRKAAGNSGIFVWATEESLNALKPGGLPHGIEVQVLDLGYTEQFEKSTGKKADWFTCHGDVFPVGKTKMKPFPPISPDGSRSFPRLQRSKGINEWNHYYVRGINGEIRLWVNGVEVSGGSGCNPASGYLCLESEGSPVEFRNLRIRELP